MIPTWVVARQAAQRRRAVEIVWNQGVWGGDNWSILAGTPNVDALPRVHQVRVRPEADGRADRILPAGLTQPEAFNYVKPEIARTALPILTTSRSG